MSHNRNIPILPLIILFAGIALRLALHDWHGLEGDDAFSLALSRVPVGELVAGLFRLELDIHPPLHFLLVKGWVAVAGDSLLSLRLLNTFADALTGVLLIGIVRLSDRDDRITPSLVVLLWALNPLLIFGGWLVRMYTLLGLLATAAAYATLRADRGGIVWIVIAAGLALAALYTHITGMIVLGFVGIALLWNTRKSAQKLALSVGLLAAVVVAYLPFAIPVARLALSGADLGASVNPANAVSAPAVPAAVIDAAFAFRADLSLWIVFVGAGLILAVGLWQLRGRLTLAATIAIALVGVWALGIVAGLYKPRYVVPFTPLLLIAAAYGIARLWGWRRPIGGLALIAAMIVSGMGVNGTLSRDWRDDWTAATDFVADYTLPGDVVVVVPDWGQEAFRYHYTGEAAVRGFFPQIGPDLDLDAAFAPFVADARRVWLVRYQPEVSDPVALTSAYFDARCPTATDAFPAGMTITLYNCDTVNDELPEFARPLDAQFGDVLALRGVTLGATEVTANDTRRYDESGRVLVALHWEALHPAPTDVTPRVQLTTPGGAVYGGALGYDGRYPQSSWEPGTVITWYYDLNVNPQAPAGVYNVEVMVLGADGAPLPSTGSDAGANWSIAGQVVVK